MNISKIRKLLMVCIICLGLITGVVVIIEIFNK